MSVPGQGTQVRWNHFKRGSLPQPTSTLVIYQSAVMFVGNCNMFVPLRVMSGGDRSRVGENGTQ